MIAAERKRQLMARLKRTGLEPGQYSSNRISKGNGNVLNKVFSELENWLVKNGIGIPVQNFIFAMMSLISAILLLSVFFRSGILVFILLSSISIFFIYIFVDLKGRKLIKKKEDQLESVLIDLVTILHVNPNISVALKKTAENAEDPIRRDLELVIEDTQKGLLLNEALVNILKRNRSRLVHIVISGLIAANEKGVDLIEFLKSQIDYLREKKSLTNYVRILSSGPRYTSYLIIAIPLVVLLAASVLNRGFTSVLFSTAGKTVLVYSAISYLIGFFIINRIVSLTDHDRRGAG